MTQNASPIGQQQLLPLKSIFCGPPKLGGVDRGDCCFCEDANGYIVKTVKPDPTCPHNEWFCNQLAARVGVQVTDAAIVEHVDGNVWFGSRYIQGETKNWWVEVQNNAISIGDITEDLSKIYAFDLFVNNVDRHLTNYLVIKTGNNHNIYCIDFGRSWLALGFPPSPLPLDPRFSTMLASRYLRNTLNIPFDVNSAISVIEKIKNTPTSTVSFIIGSHPDTWLSGQQKDDILNWWDGGEMLARANAIEKGLQDGSLL